MDEFKIANSSSVFDPPPKFILTRNNKSLMNEVAVDQFIHDYLLSRYITIFTIIIWTPHSLLPLGPVLYTDSKQC